MVKLTLLLMLLLALSLALACGGAPSANSTANANSNIANGPNNANSGPVEIKLDPANMPPGLSASPIIINGNVNANTKPKKGTTPTPGIPSEAEIKKMMSQPGNAAPPANAPPMMKSTKKPTATPQK